MPLHTSQYLLNILTWKVDILIIALIPPSKMCVLEVNLWPLFDKWIELLFRFWCLLAQCYPWALSYSTVLKCFSKEKKHILRRLSSPALELSSFWYKNHKRDSVRTKLLLLCLIKIIYIHNFLIHIHIFLMTFFSSISILFMFNVFFQYNLFV